MRWVVFTHIFVIYGARPPLTFCDWSQSIFVSKIAAIQRIQSRVTRNGQNVFVPVEDMWRSTLLDKRRWDWLLQGWESYDSKEPLFCHFKLRESQADQYNSDSSNKEEWEWQEEVELVIEGDKNYDVGRADERKMQAMPELPVVGSRDDPASDLQSAVQGLW